MAAGTAVFTLNRFRNLSGRYIEVLKWACTADASGSVSSPTTSGDGYDLHYYGYLSSIVVTPSAVVAPSSGYSITLLSVTRPLIPDLLFGLGVTSNLSPTAAFAGVPVSSKNSRPYYLMGDQLVPEMAGMGAGGIVTLEALILQ